MLHRSQISSAVIILQWKIASKEKKNQNQKVDFIAIIHGVQNMLRLKKKSSSQAMFYIQYSRSPSRVLDWTCATKYIRHTLDSEWTISQSEKNQRSSRGLWIDQKFIGKELLYSEVLCETCWVSSEAQTEEPFKEHFSWIGPLKLLKVKKYSHQPNRYEENWLFKMGPRTSDFMAWNQRHFVTMAITPANEIACSHQCTLRILKGSLGLLTS